MTPPRPTITTDPFEGQSLREDLVSTLDDQYSQWSYNQIDDMVTNWQQDNVTLQQTTTTTTTKEVVVPQRTPTVQQPPSLPRWTSEQIAASFTALGRPMIQAVTIPPPRRFAPKKNDNSQVGSSMMASPPPNAPRINVQWVRPLFFLVISTLRHLQQRKKILALLFRCKWLTNLFQSLHQLFHLQPNHPSLLLNESRHRFQKAIHQFSQCCVSPNGWRLL